MTDIIGNSFIEMKTRRIDEGIFDNLTLDNIDGWVRIGETSNNYVLADPTIGNTDFDSLPQSKDTRWRKYFCMQEKDRPQMIRTLDDMSSFERKYMRLYPEYEGTPYKTALFGKPKFDQSLHDELMNGLWHVGDGKVRLQHYSPAKITDGYISKQRNGQQRYSNNSDVDGSYFWGSEIPGCDQSADGAEYKYYCDIDESGIYDMMNNVKQYPSIDAAMRSEPYVALFWNGRNPRGVKSIVVVSRLKTPITFIRPLRRYSDVYDAQWNLISGGTNESVAKGGTELSKVQSLMERIGAISLNERLLAREERIINESTLNRMMKWLHDVDCAFMTGFREGKGLTVEQRHERNKTLLSSIYCNGKQYGVVKTEGVCPEGMDAEHIEEGYVVFNRDNDPDFYEDIFNLSESMKRDSFFYKPSNSDIGYLVGTNVSESSSYGQVVSPSRLMMNANGKGKRNETVFSYVSKLLSEGRMNTVEEMHPVTKWQMEEWLKHHRLNKD